MTPGRNRHTQPASLAAVVVLALLLFIVLCVVVAVTPGRSATHAAFHWKLWLCIHNQEAPWNDDNPPYYGGLQMGWWFMRTYAKRELATYGTADQWPPAIQVWVAEKAYRREGYSRSWLLSQWPNTGPPCLGYA